MKKNILWEFQKENILKVAKEKREVIYKETPIRLKADFSTETSA